MYLNGAILYVLAVRTTNLVDASKSMAVIFIKICGWTEFLEVFRKTKESAWE